MTRKAIYPDGTSTVGPYSPAVEAGDWVFLSGQTPIDPATGKLVPGDITAQTEQVFKNIFHLLHAAGLSSADVVKVTVFLTDMNDFPAMNAVYAKQFTAPYPARSTVGVKELPLGALVEIELIAKRN